MTTSVTNSLLDISSIPLPPDAELQATTTGTSNCSTLPPEVTFPLTSGSSATSVTNVTDTKTVGDHSSENLASDPVEVTNSLLDISFSSIPLPPVAELQATATGTSNCPTLPPEVTFPLTSGSSAATDVTNVTDTKTAGDHSSQNLASDPVEVKILADTKVILGGSAMLTVSACLQKPASTNNDPALQLELPDREATITTTDEEVSNQVDEETVCSSAGVSPSVAQWPSSAPVTNSGQHRQRQSRKRKAADWLTHIRSWISSDKDASEACSQPKVMALASAPASSTSDDSKPLSKSQRKAGNKAVKQLSETSKTGANDDTNSLEACSQPKVMAFQPLIASAPVESKPLSKSQRRNRNRAMRRLMMTSDTGTCNNANSLEGCSQPELSACQPLAASAPASSIPVESKPLSRSQRQRRNRSMRRSMATSLKPMSNAVVPGSDMTCRLERKANCSQRGLSPSDAIVINDGDDDVICDDLPGKESDVVPLHLEKKSLSHLCKFSSLILFIVVSLLLQKVLCFCFVRLVCLSVGARLLNSYC